MCGCFSYQIPFKCPARQPGNAEGNSFSFETAARNGKRLAKTTTHTSVQGIGIGRAFELLAANIAQVLVTRRAAQTVSKTAATSARQQKQKQGLKRMQAR